MTARGGPALLPALLAGAGCASVPVSGAGRHTVEVEGMGSDSPSALADAQKRAVEKALGVSLAEEEEVPPPAETKVRFEAEGHARTGLRRGLTARGFTVVDSGGDFVVRGLGSSGLIRDARTAPFISGQGRVSVSVLDATTGGVVWERSVSAGGLDLDPLTASARAVENAGELGGREAADGLSRLLWSR